MGPAQAHKNLGPSTGVSAVESSSTGPFVGSSSGNRASRVMWGRVRRHRRATCFRVGSLFCRRLSDGAYTLHITVMKGRNWPLGLWRCRVFAGAVSILALNHPLIISVPASSPKDPLPHCSPRAGALSLAGPECDKPIIPQWGNQGRERAGDLPEPGQEGTQWQLPGPARVLWAGEAGTQGWPAAFKEAYGSRVGNWWLHLLSICRGTSRTLRPERREKGSTEGIPVRTCVGMSE